MTTRPSPLPEAEDDAALRQRLGMLAELERWPELIAAAAPLRRQGDAFAWALHLQAVEALHDADALWREAQAGLALLPQAVPVLSMAAVAQARMGHLLQAERLVEQALGLEPRNLTLLHNKAALQADRGDRSGALDTLAQALAIDPGNVALRWKKASVLGADEQDAAAREALVEVLRLDPSHVEALRLRGLIDARFDRAGALRNLGSALRKRPDDRLARRWWWWLSRGWWPLNGFAALVVLATGMVVWHGSRRAGQPVVLPVLPVLPGPAHSLAGWALVGLALAVGLAMQRRGHLPSLGLYLVGLSMAFGLDARNSLPWKIHHAGIDSVTAGDALAWLVGAGLLMPILMYLLVVVVGMAWVGSVEDTVAFLREGIRAGQNRRLRAWLVDVARRRSTWLNLAVLLPVAILARPGANPVPFIVAMPLALPPWAWLWSGLLMPAGRLLRPSQVAWLVGGPLFVAGVWSMRGEAPLAWPLTVGATVYTLLMTQRLQRLA